MKGKFDLFLAGAWTLISIAYAFEQNWLSFMHTLIITILFLEIWSLRNNKKESPTYGN